jgi:hypothetical protein
MALRQYRGTERMDEAESRRTWDALKNAIHHIHAHNASQLSFEELYRNAYNLVLHKYGETLYNGVQGVVEAHLRDVVAGNVINGEGNLMVLAVYVVIINFNLHKTINY